MVRRREQYPLPENFTVARSFIDLPTFRLKVTGLDWFVPRKERRAPLPGAFMIRTEPENKVDEDAIAVFVGHRQVGYLRSDQAVRYAPLLRRMGDSLAVRGEQVDEGFAVHVPGSLLLRTFLDWGPVPDIAAQLSGPGGSRAWRADRRVSEWRAPIATVTSPEDTPSA